MEVQSEYFPPKEDIILQNEGAADVYLIVSGAVVSSYPWQSYKPKFVQFYTSNLITTNMWSFPEYDNNHKWERTGMCFFELQKLQI